MNNNKTNSNSLFTFTVVSSDKSSLNKHYSQDDNGKIVKRSSAKLKRGSFEVKHIESPSHLADFFDNLQPSEALIIGIPHQNGEVLSSGRITAKSINEKGAINRTKEYFKFSNTLLFDIDGSSLEINEVIPALIKIDPNLADAPILVRASSSYGVHIKGDTND